MNNFLIENLKNLDPSNEGSLFNNPNETGKNEQLKFIDSVIKKVSPKLLLETGTNKGLFDLYILDTFPDIAIITFDIMDFSEKAVSILTKEYGNRITFIKGDTNITLPIFEPPRPIKLAYIDGDHSYKGCLSDLNHCFRLNIPDILIDDYRLLMNVKKAVDIFCIDNHYDIINYTQKIDDRGLVWIKNPGLKK